jgi:hypothetical protein
MTVVPIIAISRGESVLIEPQDTTKTNTATGEIVGRTLMMGDRPVVITYAAIVPGNAKQEQIYQIDLGTIEPIPTSVSGDVITETSKKFEETYGKSDIAKTTESFAVDPWSVAGAKSKVVK